MGTDLFPDSGLPPTRRRSSVAYASVFASLAGWALILAPQDSVPVSTAWLLAAAGTLFVGAIAAATRVRQNTLRTNRRPKNSRHAFLGFSLGVLGFVGLVWSYGVSDDPQPEDTSRMDCEEHLRRIVGFYDRKRDANDLVGSRKGAVQLVRWMREFAADQEHLLVCPLDLEYPYFAEQRAVYHDDERPVHEVRSKVSYLLRDFGRFPLEGAPADAWIVCCRQGLHGRRPSHGDGVLVGFADGRVRLVPRTELGVPAGEPIRTGAAAQHPQLRTVLLIE